MNTENKNSKTQDETVEITLEEALQIAQNNAESWREKYLYLYADNENMRKRFNKEKSELSTKIKEEFILEILPILDEIDIAYKATNCYILTESMNSKLKSLGIEPFCEIGDEFDQDRHNAISLSRDKKAPSGSITNILKRGYTYNGRIIRYADVIVEE